MIGTEQEIMNSENETSSASHPSSHDRLPSNTITLHYHGSCSDCHHFHRHVPFNLPADDSEPMRFYCERCRHPIFGLGRTETQVTLASQDSFPLVDGAVDRSLSPRSCDDRTIPQPDLQQSPPLPQATNTTLLERLNAMEEQHFSARRISTATIVGERSLHSAETSPKEVAPPRRTLSIDRHRSQWLAMLLSCIHRILELLAERMCGSSRQLKFLGFGLSFHLTSDYLRNNEPSDLSSQSPRTKMPNALTVGRALSTTILNERSEFPSRLSPQDDTEHFDAPPRTQIHHPNTKEERLSIHRRDQTLRKQALQRTCVCTQDCHCKFEGSGPIDSGLLDTANHEGVDHDSEGASNSASLSNAMNSLPDHTRPNAFDHLGGLFSANYWTGEENASSNDSSHQQLQQVPTTESDTSSLSLHPSRPILPHRSLTTSWISTSPRLNHYDPRVGDAFRSLDISRQIRQSATRPSPFSWLSNGGEANNASIRSAEQSEDEPALHIGNSSGPAAATEHRQPDSQENEPITDGVHTSHSEH